MNAAWYYLDLNPEPWSIGTISTGRKNGKVFGRMSPNHGLVAYQEAVRSELEDVVSLPPGEYELVFYFWRQRIQYETASGRKATKNQVDATNMQKALEDALQGVLIDNDRNVRDIRSVIVEQGTSVRPAVVIKAAPWVHFNHAEIPETMWDKVDVASMLTLFDIDEPEPTSEGWF